MKKVFLLFSLVFLYGISFGQGKYEGKFEQMGTMLPSPNVYRTASGAPGPEYWQQRADYDIDVTLDDNKQTITGKETITYYNNSPNPLSYLWVQLDQNVRSPESNTPKVSTGGMRDSLFSKWVPGIAADEFEGGFKIKSVTDSKGKALSYFINKTMMRVELPAVMNNGDTFIFDIEWSYNINDRMTGGGRSGLEYFPKDDNYLYTIAQFYPRMAVYSDFQGWQNKQFLGSGEFALPFGNYEVSITVPSDHIVASTGTLQNPEDALTKEQAKRFEKAKKSFDEPVFIVTEEEAIANEKEKANDTKTWTFKAENVRDFAFASSRKFMWDAQAVKLPNGTTPLAMSFYPKEGNPLWEQESTKAVKATLETYSKYTIDYPYPVAISVHAASIGMEYPMICFNFGRPDEEGNYSESTKYRMIGVIIHEVGHNFFPMIINSDERQWTWMDEGLNTFVQYRTEVEQYDNFPSRRGPAANIVRYMKGDKQFIRPIMTNSEQILQFGNNAYAKPATALNVLRETVMGPELFDYAFKEYARRWAFKHPTPADLFRTMEDASAVDLDWFWKGWFFSTDHTDISVDNVKWYKYTEDKAVLENQVSANSSEEAGTATDGANAFESDPLYFTVTETPDRYYGEFMNRVDDSEIVSKAKDKNFYEVTFSNVGGLVMPIIVEFTYADGTTEIEKIPAEIWRRNENVAVKTFVKEKEVTRITVDPNLETADTELENNVYPRKDVKSAFDKFKEGTN
ncbi:M1 family metallopeptidase [Marinigracilibium pacificum]|uniref:M1 family metallopeptidase n=1 Tax=Marinigracilibium pacificum TaxID=2729599 RepID=A0A848J0R7_9BACT|nr:M1 family metallopeptidase [Marinigracilibium pacificum]NMM46842.1 M1 family metallopeptidase [Marinigracilibium pacificum]